jgi:hypothetical protein
VGFRDISRIVKVDKRTGEVVNSWGAKTEGKDANHFADLYLQHDANVLDNGNIVVFNSNNYPGNDSTSNVIIISQQPADSNRVIWRFDCNFDSLDRHMARNGGNADELKNGKYLVCTGNSDIIFEVTKDKRIVWQSEIRTRPKDSITYAHRLYRAHYISSLYPCYFSFETIEDTVSRKSQGFNIKIFNKGSEPDTYNVKILSPSGKLLLQFITGAFQPNQSTAFKINPGKHFKKGDKIEIDITSQTNPDFERKRWVVVE